MKDQNFKITTDIYASKGNRFANYIVDYIVQLAIGMLFGFLIAILSEFTESYGVYDFFIESDNKINDYIFGVIIAMVYYNIIEAITGKSVGKYITKTRVVMKDGTKPKLSDIFLRTLCRHIPFNHFSFLGEDARGWHDSISNTYVVDEKLFKAKKDASNSLDQIGQTDEY